MLVQMIIVLGVMTACGTQDKGDSKAASEPTVASATATTPVVAKAVTTEATIDPVKALVESDPSNTWLDTLTEKTWVRGTAVDMNTALTACDDNAAFELAPKEDLALAAQDGLFDALPADYAWGVTYVDGTPSYANAYDDTGKIFVSRDEHGAIIKVDEATFYCVSK